MLHHVKQGRVDESSVSTKWDLKHPGVGGKCTDGESISDIGSREVKRIKRQEKNGIGVFVSLKT